MKFILFSAIITSVMSHAYDITGSIHKSNRGEYLNVDIVISSEDSSLPKYELKGPATSDKGLVTTRMSYSGVKVYRVLNGSRHSLPNNAQVTLSWGDRAVSGNLMGVPVSGSFYQGIWLDDKIEFNGLTVDGMQSSGMMDYNSLNGRYNAKNSLRFGACEISAIDAFEKAIMNYDHYLGQNAMKINMKFCDLVITGTINYSDDVRRSCDEDGCTDDVLSTTGFVNINISKLGAESSSLSLEDDSKVRLFLTYLQLVAFDSFSE